VPPPYRGRKHGAPHVTLTRWATKGEPPADMMHFIARAITSRPQPSLRVTGVGSVTGASGAGSTSWFVTLHPDTAAELHSVVADAIAAARAAGFAQASHLRPNGDRFHITLGTTAGDVHGVEKAEPSVHAYLPHEVDGAAGAVPRQVAPCFEALSEAAMDATPAYVPPPAAARVPTRSGPDAVPLEAAQGVIDAWLRTKLKLDGGSSSSVSGPAELLRTLSWAMSHPFLAVKLRNCAAATVPAAAAMGHVLMVGVTVDPGPRSPDDDVYAVFDDVQRHVPRGLTFPVLWTKQAASDGHAFTLHPITVHPTPKFTGDEDGDGDGDGGGSGGGGGDVEVMGEEALARQMGGVASFVVTEKANGEMFTITVLASLPEGAGGQPLYLVAAGSKHAKYAVWVAADGVPVCNDGTRATSPIAWLRATYEAKLPRGGPELDNWFRDQLWAEMLCFALEGLAGDARLLPFLLAGGWTACGEFESWLHPHIVPFAPGHRAIKYFALTRRAANTCTHEPYTATQRLAHLAELAALGAQTVEHHRWEGAPDIVALRRSVWTSSRREGCVVLSLDAEGRVVKMTKLKTMWYVVSRGLRERFKNWKPESAPRTARDATFTLAAATSQAEAKVREKLAIFFALDAAGDIVASVGERCGAFARAFAAVLHRGINEGVVAGAGAGAGVGVEGASEAGGEVCVPAAWRRRWEHDFPGILVEAEGRAGW